MEPFKSLPELTIQKVFVPTGPGMESASDEEDVRQVDSESEGVDSESEGVDSESSEDIKASAAEDGDNEDEDEAEKRGGINGESKSVIEEKVHVPENGPEVDEEIKSDVSPSLCNSIKKRKNSDSEKDTIKKKKRKRKREAKVKKEENTESESESDQLPKEKRPKNLRKNIREVMTEDVLDEETKAAQRQEMERLIRVQEQRIELERYVREQKASMQHLARLDNCVITPVGADQKPFVKNNQLPSFGSWNSFEQDPMYNPTNILRKTVLEHLMPHFADAKKSHPSVQLTNAVKHASAPAAQGDPESMKPEEVTISSDDDDCMVVDVSDEEEETDDPTNSGSHTNDRFNIPDEQGRVLINVHEFSKGEPGVFLAPQIARIIKPHQIGGIRFLYDNVIESLVRCRANEGFGCILAHSMGLGKTLQVVSFCDIFLRHTDSRRVLCVMPINTLQNWHAEFDMWIPEVPPADAIADFRPRNFKLHLLNDAQKTLVARAKVIRQWKVDGGVLLIGYECYRNLCQDKKSTRKRKCTPLVDVEEPDAKKLLLLNEIHDALLKPGPDLVICDEGHRIKNPHATTSNALKSIQTKRRVVLTGYPLQNNLTEYWCMVDFVRPNYLGTKNEFSNMFERPISNGNCQDSTPDDKRTMRYRAHVLHSLLNGFVQRRSHDVLQQALPPKQEFVLMFRMGDIQKLLYSAFKNVHLKTKAATNPLKAFAVYTKIWNHPDILYNHLTKNKMGKDSDLEEIIGGTIEESAGPAQSGKKTRPKKTAKPVTEAKVDVVVKAIAPIQDASHSAQNKDFQFNQNLGYGESSNQYNQQLYQQQAYFNNSQQQCYQQPPNQFQAGAEHQEPYKSLAMGQSFQSQQQCWPQQGEYGQSQSSFGGQFDNSYGMLPTTLKPNNEAMMDMIDKKGEEIQSMEKMIDEKIANNTREEELKGSNMPKSGKEDSNSISYDWALEIMKGYILGMIEQGPKMLAVFCILEECSKINDRVLLFSQSLYTLNMIEDYLHKNLVPGTNENWTKNVHYFRLDGNTPAIERERLINEFNANTKVTLFLVSTKAGSLGINLVGANRVIVFDASWNPCHDTQAICRVFRYGQTKPCYVYRLVMDNCMEKRIYDRQVSKQGMADRVVDELNPDAHLSMKDSSNLMCDSEDDCPIIDLSVDASKYSNDSVLQKLLEKHGTILTKPPFRHESLLIDRKDKKLSKAEKRLAQRHYNKDKEANTKPVNNYYGGQQGSFSTSGGGIVHATPPTHSIRHEQHAAPAVRPSQVPQASPPNWRPAEFFEQQGMRVREFNLQKDMTFNTMGHKETALKAGEKVMVMKGPKGVLLQFRNGQITALKSNMKNGNINNNNYVPNAVRNLLPRHSELTVTSWPSGQALNNSAHGQVQPDVHDLTSCSSGSNSPGGMAPLAYDNQQMSVLNKGINSIPLPHTLMRSNFHPNYNLQHERQQPYRQSLLRSSGGGIVATNAEMQSNLGYQQNYNAYDQQMQQQQQQQPPPHQQPHQQQPYGNNSYSAFHRPNFASNNSYVSQYNFGGNSNMYQNAITAEMYAPPEYAQESDTYQQQSGFNPMFSSSSQSSGHHYSHQQS